MRVRTALDDVCERGEGDFNSNQTALGCENNLHTSDELHEELSRPHEVNPTGLDLGGAEEGGRDGALEEVALGLSRVHLRRDPGVGIRPLQSVLVHRELRAGGGEQAGGRGERGASMTATQGRVGYCIQHSRRLDYMHTLELI